MFNHKYDSTSLYTIVYKKSDTEVRLKRLDFKKPEDKLFYATADVVYSFNGWPSDRWLGRADDSHA